MNRELCVTAKVRAWAERNTDNEDEPTANGKTGYARRSPGVILVFDTETTADIYQNLRLGAYLLAWISDDYSEIWPFEEGLFYSDELPESDPEGFKVLKEYAEKGKRFAWYDHEVEDSIYSERHDMWMVARDYEAPYDSIVDSLGVDDASYRLGMPRRPNINLEFMSCSAFVNDILYEAAYPEFVRAKEAKPATIVGANLPFDLTRIARGVRKGAHKFRGGFYLNLLPDSEADTFEPSFVERIKRVADVGIVRRGPRGQMMDFTNRFKGTRAYFTDILNLGWNLTNSPFGLDSAAKAFSPVFDSGYVARKSEKPDFGGPITDDYITYCRNDVHTTAATYFGMVREVSKHTGSYDETRSYSPAALPKSYYRSMGITPPLEKQPDFSRGILGYAMSTFYGARAECHIRKTPVPVAYYDFTSMYPTVDALMNLWDFLIHERIDTRKETEEVRSLLESITLDDLFKRDTWPTLRGIALIKPDGNILPVRTKLGIQASTIAISYTSSDSPMWYTIPDLVMSVILTGKVPEVLEAYRFYPAGNLLSALKPVSLRGEIGIDPAKQDFFRLAMEQRQAIKLASKGCKCGQCDQCRQSSSLKVTANSGAYGLFAEFNPEPNDDELSIYGIGEPYSTSETSKVDLPGKYSFPPISTLITGAARLMLGMAEKLVTDAGGTWAFCDTDSMAIVADSKVRIRQDGIPVLSYAQTDEIAKRFDALNPYDPAVAPGIHILKREYDDDPRTLYAYSIASKRYGLFRYGPGGSIEVLAGEGRKEHGIGAFMPPADPSPYETTSEPEKGKRQHVTQLWHYLISRALGLNPREPEFFKLPAMTKLAVNTWTGYNAFKAVNDGKPWSQQIKPGNFVMAPVVSKITELYHAGKPPRLIAPFRSDPKDWLESEYIDIHNPDDGYKYRITTDSSPADPVGVKTWGDIAREFDLHPEAKYCDSKGQICEANTKGLLRRHHLRIARVEYIGKESNRLMASEKALEEDEEILDYGSGRDDVRELVLPVLAHCGYESNRSLAKLTGKNERSVRRFLARDSLTGDMRNDVKSLRDSLTREALRLAVMWMNNHNCLDDPAWKFPHVQTEHCWLILTRCLMEMQSEN